MAQNRLFHVSICLALLLAMPGCGCGLRSGSWAARGRYATPEHYPLGSVNRAHYQAMETNAEATDFVLNRNEFVGETSELTNDGRDHVLEIAARMRSAPFPVVVERSENNSNPELDTERRNVIAHYLGGLGNPDAEQRTFVATPYAKGLNSFEGQIDYNIYYSLRNFGGGFGAGGLGFGGLGGVGGGFGGAGGFGGGGGGGFGFGP